MTRGKELAPGNRKAYVAHGPLRRLSAKGLVEILPWHFLRAARLARSGLAVLALAATSADGAASRIVPAVSGPVTTPQSDVDLVITEFGAADR